MSDSGARWLVEEQLPEVLEGLARTLDWLGEREDGLGDRLYAAADLLRGKEAGGAA